MKTVFEQIYAENKWGNGSGPGSSPDDCEQYLRFLKLFYSGRHALEIGCGDMQMYRHFGVGFFKSYIGLDVVDRSKEWQYYLDKYFPTVQFTTYDGEIYCRYFDIDSLENYDVILIKDVLNHLPTEHIQRWINHIKVGKPSKTHLVLTHDFNPSLATSNSDVSIGGHRPLALELAPFDFATRFSFIWPCAGEGRMKQTIVI